MSDKTLKEKLKEVVYKLQADVRQMSAITSPDVAESTISLAHRLGAMNYAAHIFSDRLSELENLIWEVKEEPR